MQKLTLYRGTYSPGSYCLGDQKKLKLCHQTPSASICDASAVPFPLAMADQTSWTCLPSADPSTHFGSEHPRTCQSVCPSANGQTLAQNAHCNKGRSDQMKELLKIEKIFLHLHCNTGVCCVKSYVSNVRRGLLHKIVRLETYLPVGTFYWE